MSVYKMGILPGDGIGPEIVSATLDVLTAAALYHWTITFARWRNSIRRFRLMIITSMR